MTFESNIIYIDALATPLQDNFNLLLKQNKNKQTKGGFQNRLLFRTNYNKQSIGLIYLIQ